jgi:effector-binding domain-containing protein
VTRLRELLEARRAELGRRVEEDRRRLAQIAARLNSIEADELHPLGDVVMRRVPAMLMATIRETVPSLGKPVERLFDEVEAFAARHSARADSNPLMVFHRWGREPLDVEVAVPVKRPLAHSARVTVREVRGADEMACLAYTGGYHQTPRAVETLRAWAAAIDWHIGGEIREVYVRFGADDAETLKLPTRFLANSASEYVTEVQAPVIRGNVEVHRS